MKKFRIISILSSLIFVCGALFFSCNDDDVEAKAKPEILFASEPLEIDLNKSNNPPLISVINSETGLKSIELYLLKDGDVEMQFEEPITSFFNKNSYSVSLNLVYTEDMTGFKIIATDLANQVTTSTLAFDITPLRNPPLVEFNDGITELDYTEGSAMPQLIITISSEEELRYVVLSEVVNKLETKIPINGNDTLKFTGGEKTFSINMADDAYQFREGTTALKATVAAGPANNAKIKVGTLYVDYILIPAPVITYDNKDEYASVNEFASLTLTGKVEAISKISSIKYYKSTTGGLEEIGTPVSFDPAVASYDFSITLDYATVDVDGIVVEATDALGKVTATKKKVQVIELAPPPAIALDQADATFNGVTKDSNLSLTGSITTEAELTEVTIVTIKRDGTEAPSSGTITPANNKNYPLNETIPAPADLGGIRIEAKDINGKITIKSIDVHVGYYYYHVLASGDGSATYNSDEICFFSAAKGTALGYCDAKDNIEFVDVNFSTYSTNTAMCVSSLVNETKFRHPTCGLQTWPSVRKLKIKKSSSITRSIFDKTTIDNMLSEAAPTGTDTRINLTVGNFETPTEDVAMYITQIDGVDKRVILSYDKFEKRTTNAAASRFWIKVKVEK